METKVPRPRGRPRKRPRLEDETGRSNAKSANRGKRRAVETRQAPAVPISLLGRYVLKEFANNGVFLGKVVLYDTGLYRVVYEDGDFEDLESRELRDLILGEDYFDDELIVRRKRLDELIQKRNEKKKEADLRNEAKRVETPALSDPGGELTVHDDGAEIEDDTYSSSDSCEDAGDKDSDLEAEVPCEQLLQLPLSSGTIGVPEESVSHLLSVYGFLRSFSVQLYLYPFSLDDFVGALNCSASNSLLDSIHVALMRALKRQLERLSSEGSELASKCLRCIDWSLLDALTWPVYLVQYFTAMGYTSGPYWKKFCELAVEKEYYSLSTGMKLKILQILCDDVLDVAELRAEIDIREELEVGIDPDAVVVDLPEHGPRRVHPRYAKTSACKESEGIDIGAVSHGMNSFDKSKYWGSRGTEVDANAANTDPDGNSDECRLCGMDGTLLCCDGCPSAYHSRCIGVVKMYIPEGSWYCPECTFQKTGPIIAVGTSLKGATLFGVDQHGQIFLGTCNHLLVLKTSINSELGAAYYNANDIPRVVQVLLSSTHHAPVYLEICKAIIQYWDIAGSIIPDLRAVEMGTNGVQGKKDEDSCLASSPLCGKNYERSETGQPESAGSFNGSHLKNVADSSTHSMIQTNHLGALKGEFSQPPLNVKPPEHVKMEAIASTCLLGLQDGSSYVKCQNSSNKSNTIGLTTCASGSGSDISRGNLSGTFLPEMAFSQSQQGNHAGVGRGNRNSAKDVAYMGSSFKPQLYVNHYTNGEFAASAATSLAVLSSEETQDPEPQKYNSVRKASSSSILLQTKAFSSATPRFFWPSSERKEIARERCGWCHSCKLTSASRRGCMLNAAVTSATKNATKVFSGLLPLKNGEGSLSSIAAYILYLEDSLRGLIAGPFLSESHRDHWRKQVTEASTCKTIKALLLELGENICSIGMSGDWVKLVDDWLLDHSLIQSASSSLETARKRGPGRRRQRNQSEVTVEGREDDGFTWWRGGKLSKHILQKAVLPHSMIRKAACQGGIRKISGFNYADGSGIPKRSRQCIWKAAVESSRNLSQLALQVRYLDMNVRWSDLVRPEQNLQDNKSTETEASVFRNASICDKKIVDNKVRYGIAFGNQKHLPSRVMKSVIDVEENQAGNEKYWFTELHVPLYLIKEYEENLHKAPLPSDTKPSNVLSELQRKQLKASRRRIFSYLACKRDNLERCSCASCKQDVLLRNAATCIACQGYCHKDCTFGSECTNGTVRVLFTCKGCYLAKARSRISISNKPQITPLSLSGREHQTMVTPITKIQSKASFQQSSSIKAQENGSGIKQGTSESHLATKSQKFLSWGVIWRKRNNEDTGVGFRRKNILLGGSSERNHVKPVCHLCQQPYNPRLTYIHCETCKRWYHTQAIELEESRIPDVVGFKCCKCRRIRSPECPYMDPMLKEQKSRKKSVGPQKQGQRNTSFDSDSERISESKDSKPSTPSFPTEEAFVPDDDPLLFSVSKVEQITENHLDFEWKNKNAASGPGLQKLPVRRQVKREGNIDSPGNSLSHAEFSSYPGAHTSVKAEEEQTLPITDWDAAGNGVEGDLMFDYGTLNYEDMEFEPQTYFSLSELLETNDGGQCDGLDFAGASGNMENEYCLISQGGTEEQFGTYASGYRETVLSDANEIPCQICSHVEPAPNLSCQVCGFLIHGHCSPWEEESSCGEGSWRCGRCREWR